MMFLKAITSLFDALDPTGSVRSKSTLGIDLVKVPLGEKKCLFTHTSGDRAKPTSAIDMCTYLGNSDDDWRNFVRECYAAEWDIKIILYNETGEAGVLDYNLERTMHLYYVV